MAEAGTPQPDGPRPPTPRPRGDRGRDPAALAAWRRVAEQRRRAGDKTTSPADPSTAEPAAVEPVVEAPVAEPSVVEAPVVERPAAGRPAVERPATERPAAGRAATTRPTAAEPVADRPAAAEPTAERPAAGEPTAGRPAAAEPTAERPTTARPAAQRPAAAKPAVERPVDRPSGPRPVVDRPAPSRPATSRPAARHPAPARPAAMGTGDDLVRAVQDDHAHGEPAHPQTRPAPPPAREEPASSRPGSDGGPPPTGRLHDVLLGLAGRLDDDALTSVREMVAAEDDAEAAELLGGCLLAGGIGLTGEERAVLRPWFTAARVDPELLGMLPSDTGALDRSVHRFVTTAPDRAPGIPLARAARRLSGVVAVRESWRVTPAGSAPGPVPHRVVLVETVGADDCDHVVHHLAHAARVLDDTSVEVFATGAGLPAYHRAALAVARPLVAEDAAATAAAPAAPVAPARPAPPTVARPVPPRSGPPAQRYGAAEDEETWRTVADAGTSRTGPPGTVPPEPADVEDDADEPELVDLDEPEPEPEPEPEAEAADPEDEPEETSAARVVASPRPAAPTQPPAAPVEPPPDRAGPARPARPAADGAPRPAKPPAPPQTSIDEDLSSTARRIAALWARPSPEDFSAPLPADSLEPTHLEPGREDAPAEPEDEAPSGRHGRPAVADMGTTSFRSPRTRSRTNGHPVPRSVEPTAGREDTAPPVADRAPTSTPAEDDAPDPDSAQLPRTRHRRPRDGDVPQQPDTGPARFGHDARFGAGPGPAWPGGPVTGDTRPGPDTLFTSPVEVGEEPVSFGTNGHRHDPEPDPYDDEPDTLGTDGHRHEPVVAAVDDEPDTGPVAWAIPAGPGPVAPPPPPRVVGPPPGAGPAVVPPPPGPPVGRPPGGGPRRPGDPGDPGHEVAPSWAADEAGWVPDGAHAPDPDAAAWSPDDDSVAQLSDRERELLARLHEELAQRERSEGADPFGPPRPTQNRFRPRPGSPGGRVNGHGLPSGGPDDASA